MKILVRYAVNDFDALTIATGMEKAHASVFSITHDGQRFSIWCKYDATTTPDHIYMMVNREIEAVRSKTC